MIRLADDPISREDHNIPSKLIRKVNDLRVYQDAFAIALDIHKASLVFPKVEQYALADQMRRASKSICANLAEAFARQQASELEFKRFITIAISSSDEMQVWVEFAKALNYISEADAAKWMDKYEHISRMLQKLKG